MTNVEELNQSIPHQSGAVSVDICSMILTAYYRWPTNNVRKTANTDIRLLETFSSALVQSVRPTVKSSARAACALPAFMREFCIQ